MYVIQSFVSYNLTWSKIVNNPYNIHRDFIFWFGELLFDTRHPLNERRVQAIVVSRYENLKYMVSRELIGPHINGQKKHENIIWS